MGPTPLPSPDSARVSQRLRFRQGIGDGVGNGCPVRRDLVPPFRPMANAACSMLFCPGCLPSQQLPERFALNRLGEFLTYQRPSDKSLFHSLTRGLVLVFFNRASTSVTPKAFRSSSAAL